MSNRLYLQHDIQTKNNQISSLFHRTLFNENEDGSVEALQYLRNRGVSDDLIEKFQIGWYPPNRYVPNRNPLLAGRIIFPIFDEYGDVRAFSGRPVKWSKGDSVPKYFHESYPKGYFLYGLNLAWRKILHLNWVVLVEGQTDVIACHRSGLTNTVGVMGSYLKYEGFTKVSRFCDRFILMFDQDEAGIECSEKTEKLLESYGKTNITVRLKTNDGGFDPDEFAKKYGDKAIGKAVTFFVNKYKSKELKNGK